MRVGGDRGGGGGDYKKRRGGRKTGKKIKAEGIRDRAKEAKKLIGEKLEEGMKREIE